MRKAGASRLREMLARNHDIALDVSRKDFPMQAFEHLQHWQSARIALSFEDMLSRPGYAEAGQFFLSELYGGEDFRARDQDIGKVMPVMIKFLPDKALRSMARAFELQAISLEYDMAMARWMHAHDVHSLDMQAYLEVYLACSDPAGRERQIDLILELGLDLENLVRKPFVNTLIKLLHGPAHAAGFGALQDFLERGLASFRALGDATEFVETIQRREKASMERIFAGEKDPFGLEGRFLTEPAAEMALEVGADFPLDLGGQK